ncbi:MAG TPA: VOC family protein, partial [Bacteroidia bacterium]|nr:VOC family protein [Bacteroidia bacterium]
MNPSSPPAPKLGTVTAVTITTPDLESSLAFYRRLGFSELFRADFPFPWIQITDGALLLMLRKDNDPYIALTYYAKDAEKIAAELEAGGITFEQKAKPSDFIKRFLFRSPDGLNISIVTLADGFHQPAGPTLLNMPPADYFSPEKYPNKSCGLFGEFAHPVKDIEASIAFWQKLGFRALSRHESP